MRIIQMALAGLVFAGMAGSPFGVNAQALTNEDYILCAAHMERMSTKALTGTNYDQDHKGLQKCKPRAGADPDEVPLTAEQLHQFSKAMGLLAIQVQAPSMTVHGQLAMEIGKFVRMLD